MCACVVIHIRHARARIHTCKERTHSRTHIRSHATTTLPVVSVAVTVLVVTPSPTGRTGATEHQPCTPWEGDTVLLVEFHEDRYTVFGIGWGADVIGETTTRSLGEDNYGLQLRENSYLSLTQSEAERTPSFTVEVVIEAVFKPNSHDTHLVWNRSVTRPIIAEDETIGFFLCVARATNAECKEEWKNRRFHSPDGADYLVRHYALSYDSTQRAVRLYVDGACVSRSSARNKCVW